MSHRAQKQTLGLVSQYPAIGGLLHNYLATNARLEVLWETHIGLEGIRLCTKSPPRVVIISPRFPDMTGVDFTRAIRQKRPEVRVLLFAGVINREIVQEIMSACVHGIVAATSPLPALLTAVNVLLQGGCYFDGMAESLLHAKEAALPHLTAREREVLRLIAEGFSTKEIASKLSVSVKTADKFRERLMHKLNLHDAVKLTRYAIRTGIVSVC